MKRRKNGCGTLISKGKGKPWLAKWKFDGKTYYRSTGETVREKALIKLAEFVKPYQEKTEVEVLNNLVARAKSADELRSKTLEESKRLRIDELTERFNNDVRSADTSANTLDLYEGYVNSLIRYEPSEHKAEYIDEIDETYAEGFLNWLKTQVSAHVWNFTLIFYRRLWKMFGSEYGCETNPWAKFEKRKVNAGTTRRAFTEDELMKLLDYAKSDEQLTLMIALGIYTGLRRGDCSKLEWRHVDFDNAEIVIKPEKVKRHLVAPIRIPIHPALMVLLKKRKAADDGSQFILPKWHISKENVNSRLKHVFKACGIKTSFKDENGRIKMILGFHSLRHTFVSMNINGGMNPMLIQKIVGHSTVNMTEHYFHQNMSVIREGISKMPDMFDTGAKLVETADLRIEKSLLDEMMKATGSDDATTAIKRLLGAYGSLRKGETEESPAKAAVA